MNTTDALLLLEWARATTAFAEDKMQEIEDEQHIYPSMFIALCRVCDELQEMIVDLEPYEMGLML